MALQSQEEDTAWPIGIRFAKARFEQRQSRFQLARHVGRGPSPSIRTPGHTQPGSPFTSFRIFRSSETAHHAWVRSCTRRRCPAPRLKSRMLRDMLRLLSGCSTAAPSSPSLPPNNYSGEKLLENAAEASCSAVGALAVKNLHRVQCVRNPCDVPAWYNSRACTNARSVKSPPAELPSAWRDSASLVAWFPPPLDVGPA